MWNVFRVARQQNCNSNSNSNDKNNRSTGLKINRKANQGRSHNAATRAHLQWGGLKKGPWGQGPGQRATSSNVPADSQTDSWAETETETETVTKTEKDGTTGSRLNGKLFACWTAIGSARTAEQSKRSHWPGIRLTIPIAVERLAAILALWPPQTITTATTKEMPWNRHLPASYSRSFCSSYATSLHSLPHPQQSQQSA